MLKPKIILQGGGEHARVVLDCLLDNQYEVLALFDPKYKGELFGIPQRGVYDPEFHPKANVVIAIGDNQVRKQVADRMKAMHAPHAYTNAVHSSAIISRFASMGTGNMILHRTVVQAKTVIGNHVIINTGAQVDHDCVIGDYVHLGPGSVLCGTVEIGEGTFVGAGATIIPGKKIGRWSVVGAGAVVVTDIPDHAVVVGNPAKMIKTRSL